MENIKLEQSFLESLLTQPDATAITRACASILTADDFTGEHNAKTWRVILETLKRGAVDLPNVFATSEATGAKVDLTRYITSTYSTGDIVPVAVALHELGLKRRLAASLSEVLMSMEEPTTTTAAVIDELNAAMSEANKNTTRQLTAWPELYQRILKNLQDKANGIAPQGVATGYKLIDNEGGLEEGALVIVAGRTSNGKTAYALNLALNIAWRGVPVVVFSLEMTNEQVGARLLANISGVSQGAIKSAQLNDEQWASLCEAGQPLPLYFDDARANSKNQIFAAIRNVVDTHGARVVFIDYLQLVKGAGKDRRTDIGDIANELKVLAVQLKITIVLLSQLAREQKGVQPTPKISELKESGEIENAADAVYMIYRPEQHGADVPFPDLSRRWSEYDTHGNALLICAKNRNGQTGEQLLGFDGQTSRFFEREKYELASGHKGANFSPLWSQ